MQKKNKINNLLFFFLVFVFVFSCANKDNNSKNIKTKVQKSAFYYIDKINLRNDIILEEELPFYNYLGSATSGINCAKSFLYKNNSIFITRSDYRSKDEFNIIEKYNDEILGIAGQLCLFKIDSLKLDINNNIYIYSDTSKDLKWNTVTIGKKIKESFIHVSIGNHVLHKYEKNIIEKEVVDSIYYSLKRLN